MQTAKHYIRSSPFWQQGVPQLGGVPLDQPAHYTVITGRSLVHSCLLVNNLTATEILPFDGPLKPEFGALMARSIIRITPTAAWSNVSCRLHTLSSAHEGVSVDFSSVDFGAPLAEVQELVRFRVFAMLQVHLGALLSDASDGSCC
jgi:hypothetical protein